MVANIGTVPFRTEGLGLDDWRDGRNLPHRRHPIVRVLLVINFFPFLLLSFSSRLSWDSLGSLPRGVFAQCSLLCHIFQRFPCICLTRVASIRRLERLAGM